MLDPAIRGRCRNLLKEHDDLLNQISREVCEALDSERVSEETAFLYAKKIIRREAIREGITMFLSKINKYASEG